MSDLDTLFGQRGRVALVVGASSGIGTEAARALARAGAKVGLVARRADRLEEVARELDASGAKTCTAVADVTNTPEIETAFEAVESALGPVNVVVNSAGISQLRRAERHGRELWDPTIAVNLTAAFEISQAAGRRWIERGDGGRLIHVSSVMGRVGNAVHRAVGYTASKAGLDGLTRQLAIEWAPHGITVNALAPAYFPSEMTTDPETGEIPPAMRERMEQFTPLGRVGRPGELESAILFLAAPASTYVTGVVLPVDGGWTAW